MAELILALDIPGKVQSLALARRLAGLVPWCKVGLELFCVAGPEIIAELRAMGFRVFLDLKFYDIPHTVAQAVKAAGESGAEILTIHCQGGERMCKAAVDAAQACAVRPRIFGVTALTSFGPGEMPGIRLDPADFALKLAENAASWGLDGVVCSGAECAKIKQIQPGLLCLCPGIRPKGEALNDQRRAVTPEEAVSQGADYLVVGRPILKAQDPRLCAEQILAQMRNGESARLA